MKLIRKSPFLKGFFCVLSFRTVFQELRSMVLDFSKYDINKAREIARKFGSATLTQMIFNIHQLDLVDKGKLLETLKFSVHTSHQEVDRISFSYEWYGKFHEVGATDAFGKGVTITPKHWRNDAISKNKEQLEQDFTDFYAELIIEEIKIDSVKLKM